MITPPSAVTEAPSRPWLSVTRGLPGSGKTTWALERIASRPHGTIVRVNRDALRRMLHGIPRYDHESEAEVSVVQHGTISTFLLLGKSVVVDDTNLDDRRIDQLEAFARGCGAGFHVQDFTYVPLDECIRRDLQRKGTDAYVGEEVIRDMHARHRHHLAGETQ